MTQSSHFVILAAMALICMGAGGVLNCIHHVLVRACQCGMILFFAFVVLAFSTNSITIPVVMFLSSAHCQQLALSPGSLCVITFDPYHFAGCQYFGLDSYAAFFCQLLPLFLSFSWKLVIVLANCYFFILLCSIPLLV